MPGEIPERVESLLESEPLAAYLATCSEDRPHVAPVWYHYEPGVIEITTTGRKLANLEANPRVSLAIQKGEARSPEWMVTLLGTATVVDDATASEAIHEAINEKYDAPAGAFAENTPVRIDVGSASYQEY